MSRNSAKLAPAGLMQTTSPLPTHCTKCNAPFPIHPPGYSGGSGYACLASGGVVCYSCADALQRDELKDHSKPFGAYVSSDGQTITTWTGGRLMDVVRSQPCALTRASYTHDSRSYRSIRARDVHGNLWHGRGSAGVCITLRPMKG